MKEFLFESTLCMAVLLGLYYLLLEREKMHRFNRFFLLGAIVLSLVLPFITVPVYIEATTAPLLEMGLGPMPSMTVAQEETTNYWPYAATTIYLLGFIFLAARFMVNIRRLSKRAGVNAIVPYHTAKLVLLEEETLPHTFLNYIFVNRQEYESRTIENELFTHELVHVNQKHTLDILLLEVLMTILWFNPLMYCYKKAIQLNHEFLADEEVVKTTHDAIYYQRLLLSRANAGTTFALASNLNFSITKKRFTMMTKATTRSRGLVLKLASLPVITGLVIFFCIEGIAQEKPTTAKTTVKQTQTTDERRDAYYKGVQVIIDDKANGVLIDKPFEEFTEEEKDYYLLFAPELYVVKHPTKKEFESFKNKKGYALQIDGKDVDNAILNHYKPEDFAYYSGYTMAREALTKKNPQIFHYQLYTRDYFEKHLKGTNNHYPDKVFKITITKEIKDDKVVAENGKRGTFDNVPAAMEYLKEKDIYANTGLTKQPEYPGGMTAFYEFVNENLKVPQTVNGNHKILISFVIEKNGTITNVKTLRDAGQGLSEEAVRVVSLSQKWIPGEINGKPVRVSYSLPISVYVKK